MRLRHGAFKCGEPRNALHISVGSSRKKKTKVDSKEKRTDEKRQRPGDTEGDRTEEKRARDRKKEGATNVGERGGNDCKNLWYTVVVAFTHNFKKQRAGDEEERKDKSEEGRERETRDENEGSKELEVELGWNLEWAISDKGRFSH